MLTRYILNGRPLELELGAKPYFPGPVLDGAQVYLGRFPGGYLIVQQICSIRGFIRYHLIRSAAALNLELHRQFAGRYYLTALGGGISGMMTGSGKFRLRAAQLLAMEGLIWKTEFRCAGDSPLLLVELGCRSLAAPLRYTELTTHLSPLGERLLSLGHPDTRCSSHVRLDLPLPRIPSFEEFLRDNDNKHRGRSELKGYGLALRARDLIIADLDAHHPIPALAAMLGVNSFLLKTSFRAAMGRGLYEYLLYRRCLRAREAMHEGGRPAKSCYREGGYGSLSAFVTGFRRQLGCTPGEWLHQLGKLK